MAQIYRQNGSIYDASNNQKIPDVATLQKNYAGATEIKAPTIPFGATKISGPSGLQGLKESDIYRSGADIYKLPSSMTSGSIVGDKVPSPIKPVNNYDSTDVTSLMAGTDVTKKGLESQIKLAGQTTPEETAKTKLQDEFATTAGDIKTAKTAAIKQGQQTYDLEGNTKNLQNVNIQLATKKAEYDNYIIAQEGRTGLAGSIYGRQALLTRQKAVEVAGLSAVAQAYQGNITLATDTIEKSVNALYKPQEDYLANLKDQLTNSYTDLTAAEKKKADQLQLVIDERTRLLTQEKEDKTAINNVAIEAAKNGADTATVNKILSSKTQGDAIKNSGTYLKTASNATWDTFTDSSGNVKLINKVTGQVKDASSVTTNLGNQVGEIQGLPTFDTATNNPGVNRSDRNNNPGNIKVSDNTKNWDGVIGVESKSAADGGNFLIFDSPESGINAIGKLLLTNGYSGMTAEKAIKRYNGNGSYGAKDVGLDPTQDFQSQLQDATKLKEVANAIAIREGFTGATKEDSTTANDYAKLVQNGTMKIENVPEKQRNAVAQALAKLPNPKDTANDAAAKEKANLAISLKTSPGLNSAVGPLKMFRTAAPWNISNKQNFIAGVEQLVSGLSLDSLISAKAQGATFGALSDTEMRILASSATRIGTWAKKDDSGKIVGYKIDEQSFKDELDNINKILLKGITSNSENQSSSDPLNLGILNVSNSTNPLGI